MKFTMRTEDLKYIMNFCKKAASKEKHKGTLQDIICQIENGTLKATAIDGYRMHNVIVPCEVLEGNDVSERFNIPIVKVPKGLVVFIEITDNKVIYDFGTETQGLNRESGTLLNVESILSKDEPVFKIGVNPKFIKEAMESFGSGKVVMQFYGDTKPIIIRKSENKDREISMNEDFALVLPVRL